MEKNDLTTLRIERLGGNGEGVASLPDGRLIFVPFVLPGEEADVRILSLKKTFAYGKAEKILRPSSERTDPACRVFTKCGGCQIQHMRDDAQRAWKRALVGDTLARLGGIDTEVEPIVFAERTYGYRNKIQIPVGVDRAGRTAIGFYRGNSHDIVPIDGCPLHGAWADKLIACVKAYMAEQNLTGYDERTGKGDVRHIVARCLDETVYVCLVTPLKTLRAARVLADKLAAAFPKFSLLYNVNPSNTNVILGKETHSLFGEDRLTSEWDGIRFSLAVPSFLQVNTEVARMLYDDVVKKARLTEEDVVVDAYSGAGILSARMAKTAKRVYGIEICKEAHEDADDLALENGLSDRMVNLLGDCAEVLPDLAARLRGSGEAEDGRLVAVLDPPRKGCGDRVLEAVLWAAPDRLIYVSCNPATLARDLKRLSEKYAVSSVTPYDLFPQTCHVETLVCLALR